MRRSAGELAAHHLAEANRHIQTAREFVRELKREDSGLLDDALSAAGSAVRVVMGEVEPKLP